MLNREVFSADPTEHPLVNNGVAQVKGFESAGDDAVLKSEIKTFVCEGQYNEGLKRILSSYIQHLDGQQPCVWISGFFGSGKSHLLKVLCALWTDFRFSDGSTARGLAELPYAVSDLLQELANNGRKFGGLHAAAGTIGAMGAQSTRIALLNIVFRSVGLPDDYPLAQFVFWLRDEGYLEDVKAAVESEGKNWDDELPNLHVSPVFARALAKCIPTFPNDEKSIGILLDRQFPFRKDVSNDEMVEAIDNALRKDGKFPCTLLAVDEIQQYIGNDPEKTYEIQEIAEMCAQHFNGRLLLVGAGQSAISDTPNLAKLKARFPIPVQLSDQDVNAVVRKTVLKKNESHVNDIRQIVERASGEVDRHLSGTTIAAHRDDGAVIVDDYPVLPTRRRFWEHVLRATDTGGTNSQLRSQLNLMHAAAVDVANKPLGAVVGGDYIYWHLAHELVNKPELPRQIYDTIAELRGRKDPDDDTRARICALVYLIGKVDKYKLGKDTGIKANAQFVADLLVEDLTTDNGLLRKNVEELLTSLVNSQKLMLVNNEYRMQTEESAAWQNDFSREYAALMSDRNRTAPHRGAQIFDYASKKIDSLTILQGVEKQKRSLKLYDGQEPPSRDGKTIPIWLRDGWNDSDSQFEKDALAAGTESETIFVFVPNQRSDELAEQIARWQAAKTVIDRNPNPRSPDATEAKRSMETERDKAKQRIDLLIKELFLETRVVQAGGQEAAGGTFEGRLENAAHTSAQRLFPKLSIADVAGWDSVVRRAGNGDQAALKAVNYDKSSAEHPVCKELLTYIGSSRPARDVFDRFSNAPYGWSRDVVDGALYVLIVTDQITATVSGQQLNADQIDRRQLRMSDLRRTTVVVTGKTKMEVRSLLGAAGVSAKTDELSKAIPRYLQVLRELAAAAGGQPPYPKLPDTALLNDIEALSGNEQIAKIAEEKDNLRELAVEWQNTAAMISQRQPRWERLQALLTHARSLDIYESIHADVEAISTHRRLLAEPHPVPPLAQKLADALRAELNARRSNYVQTYEAGIEQLEKNDAWQKLGPTKQAQLLKANDLVSAPEIDVSTEDRLVVALDTHNLDYWRNTTDALAGRFDRTRDAAIKETEPKAVRVDIPHATLRNPEEAEKWLENLKKQIEDGLNNGPVII